MLPVREFEPLPDIYGGWIVEFLGSDIPRETRATCDRCPMVIRDDGSMPDAPVVFDSTVKCCTYTPELPNYLVGAILFDESEANSFGRSSVLTRVSSRIEVTPISVGVPPDVFHLYSAVGETTFGRSPVFRCPHYHTASGRCGIWNYRNSVCMTWFCRHVRGPRGFYFWGQVRELFRAIELDLSTMCVHKLVAAPDFLTRILDARKIPLSVKLTEQLTGTSDQRYEFLWGEWVGREHEFFRACRDIVCGLQWSDVLRVCGPEVAARARSVEAAFVDLAKAPLPDRVAVAGSVAQALSGAAVATAVHGETDALQVPAALLQRLQELDHCSTAEILRADHPTADLIDETRLLALLDFGILVPDEEAA